MSARTAATTMPERRRSPLASFAGARDRVRAVKGKSAGPITVIFHAGTYRLPETLVFKPGRLGHRARSSYLRRRPR